jgi:hypothetical protein
LREFEFEAALIVVKAAKRLSGEYTRARATGSLVTLLITVPRTLLESGFEAGASWL